MIHGGIDCSVRYRHSPCPGESVVVGERAVTPITTLPRYATYGRRLLHDHAVDVRCCDDAGCWEVLSPPWTGAQSALSGRYVHPVRCGRCTPNPPHPPACAARYAHAPPAPRAHRVVKVACPIRQAGFRTLLGHAKHAQLGVRQFGSADTRCLVAAVLAPGNDDARYSSTGGGQQGEVSGGGMLTHSIVRWPISAACEALHRQSPAMQDASSVGRVTRAQHWPAGVI